MADIRAFRAWRYNLARVGALSDVVAPPYDVISPTQQQALYARHPANVVRLILNRQRPGDSDSDNRYTRAAGHWRRWTADGTVMQDPDPALYVVHQEFEAEGRRYRRRGFMARLKLEPFGAGQVLPHEYTVPAPKADRLALFRATRMNFSPILGLYPDPANEVQEVLEDAIAGSSPVQAGDEAGVLSRLWVVADHELVSRVRGLMGPRPIFIADGHHRYETALAYQRQQRAAAGHQDETPADFVLMTFVSANDPGLVIMPTHRLVGGLPGLTASQVQQRLSPWCTCSLVPDGPQAAELCWQRVQQADGGRLLGLGTAADGRWLTVRLEDPQAMAELVPQRSPAWRALPVSVLHHLVLPRLAQAPGDAERLQFEYVHRFHEVTEAVRAGRCHLACLVPAVSMEQMQQIAAGGERMPPKSTYFYPKLLSGLVFNPIG